MSRVSKTGKCVDRSSIRIFLEKQNKIAESCDDMISFTIGEPDFQTPPNIVEAAIQALSEGKTKYAPNSGIPELRKAISEDLERTHGVHYDPETEIVITPSGMDTLRLAAMAILDDDEEMIVNDPCWANHPNHSKIAHGKPVLVPVHEEDNFFYNLEELEKYVNEKTKAILLNSPNNPTGGVISHEALCAFCDFCKKHDLLVISDEVYYNIIFDGLKFYSPAMIEGMKDRVIISQSFSKTYAMTGWRLAYAAGPADIIEAIGRLNENSISCVNTFVQWAGVEAIKGTRKYIDSMVKEFENRRNIVYEGINAIDGLSCVKPQGAFYAFVNIKKTGLSAEEFATRLLEEKHVGMVPGTGFGASGEGFVRLSYATSTDNIRDGIKRMGEFVESLKK
ncbi:pyridoxal phosphate-dependent aminotransferase [Lacrimispora sp. NSJ-141]|uniref:Aminotransferase n=1 Tax=Lientehia hominis TaxID=2897778 RepID=A0AAP2RGK8_9FIRM|nr:pyridoxal phosphate-dependent aminotransferase [Lientehia hominis]MCD2491849.1 pyridoxal phosphate-dependent aminotransferase [Lientehia hominis]